MNCMQTVVQIAVSSDPENGEALYALDSLGRIWERVGDIPPRKYVKTKELGVDPARGLTETHRFFAGATAGWRLVDLTESVAIYHEEDPRHGLPAE